MNNIDWPALLVWTLLGIIGVLFWLTVAAFIWGTIT